MNICFQDDLDVEPISLGEAKTFLRVEGADHDAYLSKIISECRDKLERHLGVCMISRTIKAGNDGGGNIKLPRWPVSEVSEVRINGLVSTSVTADLRTRPCSLSVDGSPYVEVKFVSGYGPQSSDVPAPLRQAMLLLVSQAFERRNEDISVMPLMVDALTMPYRVAALV